MTTTSSRLGLSGVVADTSFNALPGALVRVMGEEFVTHADSTGSFYMPVKSGSYMVAITRDGYRDRVVSVTIPDDIGRRITAYLQPSSGPVSVREAWNLPDLNARLAWRQQTSPFFFTPEELAKQGGGGGVGATPEVATPFF